MKLNDKAVKAAQPREKPYKLTDGDGMYLLVKPNGSKYWRMFYRFAGKQKTLALGTYDDVSLKRAREKRTEARGALDRGDDPADIKRAAKVAEKVAAANSFEAIAEEWRHVKLQDTTERHQKRVKAVLKNHLNPSIGHRPINSITAADLLALLRRIESKHTGETAHRAKQIAGQVFRYAIVTGRAERDVAADLTGALRPTTTKHHAAITDPERVGKLLLAIDGYDGTPVVLAALQLSPLFFLRPGTLRKLEWADVDFEAKQIEIPAERMKLREPLILPLAKQALVILKDLHRLTGRDRYVFPSIRGPKRPMSENTLSAALTTLGYTSDIMTPHGFRAMARTLLDERLKQRIDLIEHQMGHVVRDPLGRAYNRTQHLDERRKLMQRWANYLDDLRKQARGENVKAGNFEEHSRTAKEAG